MRILALLLLSALATPAACAGDTATLDVLGFSADGAIFAFEEYGVQDGSGFPYANRFYIDTATDEFVAGTPIRIRLDDEAKTVAEARETAAAQGEKIVAAPVLAANPGFAAGSNAVTEFSADPRSMRVGPRPVFPAIDDEIEFRLTVIDAKPGSGCEGIGPVKGFRLERVLDGASETLHEDKSVPGSRGCPDDYSIAGVQTFFPGTGQAVYAVLIAIRRFGFEGPDFRFLAVTGRI